MCTTLDVLQATNGSAAEITTTLASYGNNSLSQGILRLYNAAYDTGLRKGAITTTIVLSASFFSAYGFVSFVRDCKSKKRNK